MTLQEIAPIIDLDTERTIALFMGKEDMYIKYLKKFPENARRLLPDLETAVAEGDHAKIEATAHAIKGVAANLGVRSVAEPGAALMLDIRNMTIDLVAGHHAQLVEKTALAIEYIEKLD